MTHGGKNILIVEDESIIALILKRMLSENGYHVSAVVNRAEKALDVVSRTRPDLVLMDIILKGRMDGIEAADSIIREYGVPVIYITSHTDQQTVNRALQTRPAAYITKPVHQQDLIPTVQKVLGPAPAA